MSDSVNRIPNKQQFEIILKRNAEIIKSLIGCQFPNSLLNAIDGKTISINNFMGKPVFVKLWFVYCAPCIAEIVPVNKLVKEFGDTANFLSINTDDEQTLNEFLKGTKYNAIHVFIDKERALREFCAIGGYPFNLIIDQKGIVKDVWTGGCSEPTKQTEFYERVKKNFRELLAKGNKK